MKCGDHPPMRTLSIIAALAGLITLVASVTLSLPFMPDPPSKEIGRTTEKELKVVLTSSFGSVVISKGESEKILIAEATSKKDESPRMVVDYSIRNRVGYMDVVLGEGTEEEENHKGSFKLSSLGESGKWYMRFSDAIPISFDLTLGLGKGDFDLSGLQVKDFNLSTGASDVTLSFDERNTTTIENMNIESGVSKFVARNLGNANFKRFRFQGGVGSYLLDFSGKIEKEVDVEVEVGLGVLTMIIPKEVGVRLMYEETWVSRLDCDADFHTTSDNVYTSDNLGTAATRMNIRVDSGLGSVKIRRR
ncbi:MAG: Toast rack protein [Bacteroidetes bacterium]|nr:Toast rack protein [Bacteroidota bacterium]